MTDASSGNSPDEPDRDALEFAAFDQLVLPGGDVESCTLSDERSKHDGKRLTMVALDTSILSQPNWIIGMDQTEPPFRKKGSMEKWRE